MVSTRTRRAGLNWPAGRAHRNAVIDGTPRAFLFELRD